MTDFMGLNLAQPILRAIQDEGYTTPTPIQEQSIAHLIEGRDIMGVAQTGTGKTAAFALPVLHRLSENMCKLHRRQPRALVLAPTRELAVQIGDSFRSYGRHLQLRSTVVFGGASIRPQIKALAQGVHVLVATPGRLLDLMNQGHVQLGEVEIFVLDEADRMLDMGFIPDVRRISATLPKIRQTAMFSATMPKLIKGLADSLLVDPVRVEVAPGSTTVERVEQRVFFLPKDKKRAMLDELLNDKALKRVLIFTRTKHGADRVAKQLYQSGIRSDAIHGNKTQNARQKALNSFRSGHIRALVATDVAARGIDVDGITHVINFDLPNEPESYVHRIGRTARAGTTGIAISFCDHEERGYLRDIEKTIRQSVLVVEDHPYHAADIANDTGPAKKGHRGSRSGSKGGSRNQSRSGARSDSRGDSRGDFRGRPQEGQAKNGARNGHVKPRVKHRAKHDAGNGQSTDQRSSQGAEQGARSEIRPSAKPMARTSARPPSRHATTHGVPNKKRPNQRSGQRPGQGSGQQTRQNNIKRPRRPAA